MSFHRLSLVFALCGLSSGVGVVVIDGAGHIHASKELGFQKSGSHHSHSVEPIASSRPASLVDLKMIRKEEESPEVISTHTRAVAASSSLPGLPNLHSASLLLLRLGVIGNTTADSAKPKSGAMNSILVQVALSFMGVGFVLSIVIGILSSRSQGNIEAEDEDARDGTIDRVEKVFVRRPEGLDEDLYGMGIAALIRDSQRFALKSEMLWLRVGRLAVSMLVLTFTMTLQVFLLYEMKHLVTSVSTHEAREAYDKYEVHMYGNNTANMDVTANGYHRGKDGFFDVSLFATMPDDDKDNVCQMPLSQPTFFVAILLVWALVCMAEVRRTVGLAISLVWATPTIASMKDALTETPEEGDEAVIVIGLTLPIKIITVICVLLPRLIVSSLLLWLGCRWLAGTMGFSDVLQNAVTLEFILLLKDLFYKTMAPHHNKVETRSTLILPYADKEKPSTSVFLGAFLWGVLAISYVILYVEHFQTVLPDYRWDIHDACAAYLESVESNTPAA